MTTSLAELRKMHPEDLQREIRDVRRAKEKARLDLVTGKSKASHAYRQLKEQLARALAVLGEKAQPAKAR